VFRQGAPDQDYFGFSMSHVPHKVLVLSRNYPNRILPTMGLWVQRLVQHARAYAEQRVVSPTPYCPPLITKEEYARFRRIPRLAHDAGIEILHPRFLLGPGRALYNLEAFSYYLAVRRTVEQLHARFNFNLIHAHMSYPDGVVATWLGRRYGVPVIITEHAMWARWMDENRFVRQLAVAAVQRSAFTIAATPALKESIVHFAGAADKIRLVPNGVDGEVFVPAADAREFNPDQILYVGFLNHNKGVDVLLKALQVLVRRRPALRLVLVGDALYAAAGKRRDRLHQLVADLELAGHVEFAGVKPAAEVARYMRTSALLVLPSRKETFGSVLIEALACGTPVVATRSGGPETVITDEVGELAPVEDPVALAAAIESVLRQRDRYDPARLRAYALERYSWQTVAQQTVALYDLARQA
jgi:glycosyltransferase involved in cell wall biosynthesis